MRTALLAACLLATGITPTPAPAPMPSPSLTPAPVSTPLQSQSPAPAVTASPTPAPSTPASPPSAPSPTPVATPTILMLPPNAPPQILWISLSSTTPKAGDTMSVVVLTSSNVASVELRVGGYGSGMTKTDVGHFESTSTVPRLPFFMSHSLTLQVIARNTAGVAVTQSVSIQVR